MHGKGERSTADGKRVDNHQCWGKNEARKIDQEKKVKEIRGPRMFLHAARKRLEVGDTLLPLLQIDRKGHGHPAESFRRNVAQRQLGLI